MIEQYDNPGEISLQAERKKAEAQHQTALRYQIMSPESCGTQPVQELDALLNEFELICLPDEVMADLTRSWQKECTLAYTGREIMRWRGVV